MIVLCDIDVKKKKSISIIYKFLGLEFQFFIYLISSINSIMFYQHIYGELFIIIIKFYIL